MNVTLIHHSGVLVELAHCSLLFDYYQGALHVNKEKPLYIFASHAHADHFSEKIFAIDHPEKHYILSDDIHTAHDHLSVSPHHTYHFNDLTIETLFSTDQGVAFIVTTEGQSIYFAGDLNNWHWIGEDENDNKWQKEHYLAELNRIAHRHFTLSCVVVDDRQEEAYLEGLEAFIQMTTSDAILPIHYFGHYRISETLKKAHIDAPLLFPDHDGYTVTL
jgi:hypothetical protein